MLPRKRRPPLPENPLVARLLDPQQVIVFDGAMGTMLYNKGVFINQCYDELNLRAPDLVRDVHKAYRKAGAEVLETNSFGANRIKLEQYGLSAQVADINRAAARIAREVAEDDLLVAGAVGPLGIRIEPFGPTSLDEARAAFREQLQALKDGGCDVFILETFADLHEIEQGILAAREVDPNIPVIAQMTIGADCHTPYGLSAEDLAQSLDAFGADVIGLNCSVGPQIILDAIEKMAPKTRRKLSAQPNAGMPRDVSGRSMYMASPEYMGTYARHLVQAGAKIVGGCCGTTPEHIHAMAEGIRPLAPRMASAGSGWREAGSGKREAGSGIGTADIHRESATATTDAPRPASRVPLPAEAALAEKSRWGAKLASKQFVTSVEIVPPRGVDATRMLT